MKRGFFISFEGGEGCGKSTQIARLAEHLRKEGRDVIVTREPGGTKGAELVRHVLLSGAAEKYGALTEALLFAAARADHVDALIAPAVRSGKIVLCDRFIDSTRAYQDSKQVRPYLLSLERASILDMRPDLTFILDLPAAIGLARAHQRRSAGETQDRFEREALELHEKRRQTFLEIAKQEPHRCVIINADRAIDAVAADIATITSKRLKNATD